MSSYLGFTVIAAIVTTVGTLIGLLIKEFLLVRYFDDYKEKKTLKNISKKYKDPILLAATELVRRIAEIAPYPKWIASSFKKQLLFDTSIGMLSNTNDDTYFLKYKLISTLYRFCAFFGWLELYRQDITFLNSYSKIENLQSTLILEKLRASIADGQLNTKDDWKQWKDALIFREELRSVGEGMIELINNQKIIIGYGKFQVLIESFNGTQKPLWLRPVINFFTDFDSNKDFRSERLMLLIESLNEFIKCIDKDYFNSHLKN